MNPAEQDALDKARELGIDLDMIDSNLSMSVKERWRMHDEALALALKLEAAGRKRNKQLQSSSRETR